LREADRAPIAEVAKRHGVSEQSIYSWRKRFGEMSSHEVRACSVKSRIILQGGKLLSSV
jgi:transposase-like protein